MDIRIGNDICVQIPISEFGPIDPDNIKEVRCAFINLKNTWPHDYEFHPAFHCSTQYTIRSCGHYLYNVHPHDIHMHCINNDPHCGSVVCSNRVFENRFDSYCNMSNNFINAYFPAEFLKDLGSYKCVFEIKVAEEGWDYDDLHTYTSSYEHVFDLKNSGVQGRTIVINPVNDKKYDTYICAITKDELLKYEDDYMKLISMSEGFRFSNLPGFKKNIVVNDDEKKIVVISKYDCLQFEINSYNIPMSVVKINDDYYVYISSDFYSNRSINIEITKTNDGNSIISYGEWSGELVKDKKLNVYIQPSTIESKGETVIVKVSEDYTIYKQRKIFIDGVFSGEYDEQLISKRTDQNVNGTVVIRTSLGEQYSGPVYYERGVELEIGKNNSQVSRIIYFSVTADGVTLDYTKCPNVKQKGSVLPNDPTEDPNGGNTGTNPDNPDTDDPTEDPNGGNTGTNPDNGSTDNPAGDLQTPTAYIGQIDSTIDDFSNLTLNELVQNAEIIYTKTATRTINKTVFYALIPLNLAFDNILFTDGGTLNTIKNEDLNCTHNSVIINSVKYYVYALRSWPVKGVDYTINIK